MAKINFNFNFIYLVTNYDESIVDTTSANFLQFLCDELSSSYVGKNSKFYCHNTKYYDLRISICA